MIRQLLDEIPWRIAASLLQIRLLDHRRCLRRLGSEYGGWHVPLDLLNTSSIVYSVGVGEDISFDLALIRERGCLVHAFDPTPRACEYVRRYPWLPEEFVFHPVGLWNKDGTAQFYAPRNPNHVSHSIGNIQETHRFFTATVRRLSSLMQELKHTRLDLLKMDIEGAECAVLEDMIQTGIRPSVVCVELDNPSMAARILALASLRRAGYKMLHIEHRNITLALTR